MLEGEVTEARGLLRDQTLHLRHKTEAHMQTSRMDCNTQKTTNEEDRQSNKKQPQQRQNKREVKKLASSKR